MGKIVLTPDDISALNALKVDNNTNGIINSLKQNGVPYKGKFTRNGLCNYLMSLYTKNQNLYFQVLKGSPHNPNANNYTTNPDLMNQLSSL